VIETGDLSITSRSGFNAIFKFSSVEAAESLRNGISVFVTAQAANVAGNSGASSTAVPMVPSNLEDSTNQKTLWYSNRNCCSFVTAAAASAVAVLLRDSWKPRVVQQRSPSPNPIPQKSVSIVPTPKPSPAPESVTASSLIPTASTNTAVASRLCKIDRASLDQNSQRKNHASERTASPINRSWGPSSHVSLFRRSRLPNPNLGYRL